ncbi:hypothetical protein AAULR_03509, partial [Lacticaseibacillus rhamnosus MTCC 5462]
QRAHAADFLEVYSLICAALFSMFDFDIEKSSCFLIHNDCILKAADFVSF